ncbi:MAG: hypothetical protein ACJAWN_002697 [Neolewinella sp.]|jgi:hypothetical protein
MDFGGAKVVTTELMGWRVNEPAAASTVRGALLAHLNRVSVAP